MKQVASIVLNNFTADSRVLKEGVSLTVLGYRVHVLALHDPGLPEREEMQGILVHRIRLRSRKLPKNWFFHALKYLEFFMHIFLKYRKFDIFHCHDLNALPVGYCCSRFHKGAKLIYDAHEFETERSYHQNKLYHSLIVMLERFLVRRCDRVITVSQSIAEAYASRYGIPMPELVLNCPPLRQVVRQNIFRQKFGLKEDTIIFLYQGVIGTGRGITQMIKAFSTITGKEKVMIFMGYGPWEDVVKSAAAIHTNIFYQPAVPFGEMAAYTASADWGMVYIEDVSPSYQYSLPNKLFEFVMAGVPVIATPLKEISRIVSSYQVGNILPDFSVDTLVQALNQAGKSEREKFSKGMEKVRQQYNWKTQEEVLTRIYHEL